MEELLEELKGAGAKSVHIAKMKDAISLVVNKLAPTRDALAAAATAATPPEAAAAGPSAIAAANNGGNNQAAPPCQSVPLVQNMTSAKPAHRGHVKHRDRR